jgi:hypothetical protein
MLGSAPPALWAVEKSVGGGGDYSRICPPCLFRYDATEMMQGVTDVLCYGTAVIVSWNKLQCQWRWLCA